MSQLSKDQVRHIAKLCRLNLTEDEVEKYSKELSSILEYIERLQQVDTEGIEPLTNVSGMQNSFRKDAISPDGPDANEILACSPLPLTDHQIDTPSAHG